MMDDFPFGTGLRSAFALPAPTWIGVALLLNGGFLAVATAPDREPDVFQATSPAYAVEAMGLWIERHVPIRGVVLAQGPWQRDADQGAAALWAFSHLALAVAGIPVWVLDPALAAPDAARMRERYPGQPDGVRLLLGLMTALEEGRA